MTDSSPRRVLVVKEEQIKRRGNAFKAISPLNTFSSSNRTASTAPSCLRTYLVFGRLFKLHSDFDPAIEGILVGDSAGCVVLIHETRDEEWTRAVWRTLIGKLASKGVQTLSTGISGLLLPRVAQPCVGSVSKMWSAILEYACIRDLLNSLRTLRSMSNSRGGAPHPPGNLAL